ncbi:CLUMA_CG007665, isoform A [Clunio marinus]|uniref:CLUMA_CG007665, isoform A n=1 Tax=Clunio marinus TaxID=568069 RepID=A0A1J1I302_9DIPT|nr:CLUMA_CG007665, isoform A [Clunio marinus]
MSNNIKNLFINLLLSDRPVPSIHSLHLSALDYSVRISFGLVLDQEFKKSTQVASSESTVQPPIFNIYCCQRNALWRQPRMS